MKDTICGVATCDRPAQPAYTCRHCGRILEQILAEMPWLFDELNVTLSRQAAAQHSDGSRSAEKPLPYHLQASRAISNLQALLVSWVRLIAEENGWPLPKGDPASMARWLQSRIETIRHHEAGSDCVEEFSAARAFGVACIDARRNRTSFAVGPCPEEVEGEVCEGEVWAFIPASDGEMAHMDCKACGSTWQGWQWLRLGKRILDKKSSQSASRCADRLTSEPVT